LQPGKLSLNWIINDGHTVVLVILILKNQKKLFLAKGNEKYTTNITSTSLSSVDFKNS
jgi:hypothetical protein